MNGAHSLFQTEWWLDAVAPQAWACLEVNPGGQLAARMPIFSKRKWGLSLITMPPLTPHLGPWLIQPEGQKYATRLSKEKELMGALIEKLPSCDFFLQNFHHAIGNWLPFYWAGFEQTTCYTYVLRDISDPEKVWGGFQDKARTDIRKAGKSLAIRSDVSVERVHELIASSYSRQGRVVPYSLEVLRRIDEACAKRDCRRIFFAEDAKGQAHAAIYVVWDANSAFYLAGGADPALRSSGAMSLLVWEAVKQSASVTRSFDFEGSMVEAIERFFRGFGAEQVPYFRIQKMSRRMRLLWGMREMARGAAGRTA